MRSLLQLCLLATLLLVLPAPVQAQFSYQSNRGNITITRYTGSSSVVTIPTTLIGLPVSSIGKGAFYGARVTKVLIPDGVTSIGSEAFAYCGSLTNVTLGNAVKSVGDWAFAYCPKLKSVCCRGNAPNLGGRNVFYGDLATVYYLSGATGWDSMFDGHPVLLWNPLVPFNYATNSGTITITGYTGSSGAVTIPNSVNFLPVTGIGDWTFFNNPSLTNITIPDSVTSIGNYSFSDCHVLQSITIPNNVISIGFRAFDYCGSLTCATIGNRVISIGDSAFFVCSSLTNVMIGTNVTSIGNNAFTGTDLADVKIPASVTNIGYGAFAGTSLTSVTILDSVTSLGEEAFYDCANLSNVTIGNGVTSIKEAAFESCSSLMDITFGNNLTSIGAFTFSGCRSLTSIALPHKLKSIGDDAFINCYTLTSITIPNSVTNLGSWAFAYCVSMTNAILGNQIPSIRGGSFSGTALTALTIPSSVTTIEGQAFQYCGLIKAFCKGNAPIVSPTAFDSNSSVIFYYLPGTTGWSSPFGGFTSLLWNPQVQTSGGSFGVRTNQFGFNITGATNIPIVVEACTNLSADWVPLQLVSLTNGSFTFSDPQWTNYPGRFYRLRSP